LLSCCIAQVQQLLNTARRVVHHRLRDDRLY
jgi:hypothetical protein